MSFRFGHKSKRTPPEHFDEDHMYKLDKQYIEDITFLAKAQFNPEEIHHIWISHKTENKFAYRNLSGNPRPISK
jgi:hypothetical protein